MILEAALCDDKQQLTVKPVMSLLASVYIYHNSKIRQYIHIVGLYSITEAGRRFPPLGTCKDKETALSPLKHFQTFGFSCVHIFTILCCKHKWPTYYNIQIIAEPPSWSFALRVLDLCCLKSTSFRQYDANH